MEKESFLFKYKKPNATIQPIKKVVRKKSPTMISNFLSSKNLSISISNGKKVQLPEISKTQAKLNYIDSYKNLDRINDRDSHNKAPPSPIILYLNKVKTNGLVPSSIGILKNSNVNNSLDISHYSIGNDYADCLSKGIQAIKLNRAIFKSNRLSDKGASELLKNLIPSIITEIDLSQNTIGLKTIANLCRISEAKFSALRILCLDSNNLGDRPVVLLCSVLSSSDRLVDLSLADNNISEYGGLAIAAYIKMTLVLTKLDLH